MTKPKTAPPSSEAMATALEMQDTYISDQNREEVARILDAFSAARVEEAVRAERERILKAASKDVKDAADEGDERSMMECLGRFALIINGVQP